MSKAEKSTELLQKVLMDELPEIERDEEIYNYLKDKDQVPENFIPYWEEDDDDFNIKEQL